MRLFVESITYQHICSFRLLSFFSLLLLSFFDFVFYTSVIFLSTLVLFLWFRFLRLYLSTLYPRYLFWNSFSILVSFYFSYSLSFFDFVFYTCVFPLFILIIFFGIHFLHLYLSTFHPYYLFWNSLSTLVSFYSLSFCLCMQRPFPRTVSSLPFSCNEDTKAARLLYVFDSFFAPSSVARHATNLRYATQKHATISYRCFAT